jgi:non-ribosomal peptide synthetase component F
MTLLAAFDVLLAAATGTDDIVVGGTTAGRDRVELEDLVGLFANPVALRTDVSGDPRFEDVVARVRATVLDAFDAQHAPFDQVVARIGPPRDLSRNPLVQIAFEFREFVPPAGDFGGALTCTDVGGHIGAEYGGAVTSRLDVELFVTGSADGSLDGSLVFAADLYDPANMADLADRYRRLVEAVAAGPRLRISELTAAALG